MDVARARSSFGAHTLNVGKSLMHRSKISETGTSLCQIHSGIMRRYHFHITDGVTIFHSLATTLPDDKAARTHAQKVADYFARNKVFHGATAVRVTNDQGQVVLKLPFKRSA